MEVITSRQNPRYKEIKKLIDDKKYRQETGCFFVDGVNFVAQAIENNWDVRQLVYVPNKIDSEFKKMVLTKVPAEKYFPIDESLYKALSSKKDIQGVGAVIQQKVTANTLYSGTGVVLENIANPGNLGSIARLCAAFDIKNLYTIAPSVEFFHPEAIRASMGAIFHLNLVEFESLTTMKQRLLENNYICIGTSLQEDATDLSSWTTSEVVQNTLIWFGSEARGVSSEAKELCPTLLRIPMSQAVDSLNVAESAAIIIYELVIKNSRTQELKTRMKRVWSVYEQNQLRKWKIADIDLDKFGEMPVEYITGHVDFDGLDILVNKDVLIPRVESVLMLTIAEELLANKGEIVFAEIGTGSGAIGMALNKRLKEKGKRIKGVLTDVSEPAVEVARQNYRRLFPDDTNLKIFQSDLMKSIPNELKFDLILANLPYIPTSRLPHLPESVKDFEPEIALDGGPDGLTLLKKLLIQAKDRLVADGVLILEMDYSHDISDFVDVTGYQYEIRQDEFGQNRFLLARQGEVN